MVNDNGLRIILFLQLHIFFNFKLLRIHKKLNTLLFKTLNISFIYLEEIVEFLKTINLNNLLKII